MNVRRDVGAVGADDPRGWAALGMAIALLAVIASATSLGNAFAYDDRWIIVENARAHSLHAPWKFFAETYWPNSRGAALYRPLTILLYAVQWRVGDGSPLVYHAVNVALYAALSVLLFWFALQLLPRTAAWVAAALFAVHPVHVEAVGNVVGQAELWTALSLIAAVGLYVRDRREGLPLGLTTKAQIIALFVLGMLVKENAIVLPALIVAAEIFLVADGRPLRERADDLLSWLCWLGLFAALFLLVRVAVLQDVAGDVPHPALINTTMPERALVMLGLVPEFGRLLLWPARLYADYSPQQVRVHTSWSLEHVPGVLLLSCAVILFVVSWRRSPVVAFGLAWFAVAIAPVMNLLLPTGILIAERTLLLPSAGLMLAVGAGVPWIVTQVRTVGRPSRLLAYGALAALLMLGAAHSAERQRVWRNNDAVFQSLSTDAPLNFKAHYTYGGLLFEQHRPLEAEREWRMAIALLPTYHGVHLDLAHKYRDAHVCEAAIVEYQTALRIEPMLPLGRAGLVSCYLELAQWHRARSTARTAIADGFYRRAFDYMIEVADSALVATDSADGTTRWTGQHRIIKP